MTYSCLVIGDVNFSPLVLVVLTLHTLVYLLHRNQAFKEDGAVVHFPPQMHFAYWIFLKWAPFSARCALECGWTSEELTEGIDWPDLEQSIVSALVDTHVAFKCSSRLSWTERIPHGM